MSIFRFALVGAAVGYGIYQLTKKREDGTTLLDELVDKTPEWFEKGKQYATQTINEVTDNVRNYAGDNAGTRT